MFLNCVQGELVDNGRFSGDNSEYLNFQNTVKIRKILLEQVL